MVQMYRTVWEHGLPYQQDAETTAEPAMVFRLGLTGFIFLLVVTSWLTPVWAAQAKLAWDAPTMYTDGTLATGLVSYHLSLQDNTGGLQRVDVGNQTTYTLTDLTEGLIYTITVTAKDGTIALESLPSSAITVPVPIAQPKTASTSVGTAVSIVILATDTIPAGTPLTITAVTQGAHGEVAITGTSVTYTPEDSFVGTDSFTYTITAGQGATTTATITVTVQPRPLPPPVEAGPASPPGETPGTVTVLPSPQPPPLGAGPGLPSSETPGTVTVLPSPQPPPGGAGPGLPSSETPGTVTVLPSPQPPPLGAGPGSPSSETPGTISQPVSSSQPADYSVWVGYADLTDALPINFPTPWDGSPGVIFKGCPGCPILDAGAVRIVNNTGGTLTVNAVIVRLDTCTFNLWPSDISLPFGGELIVTQTANSGDGGCTVNEQFDTLAVSPHGADSTGVCTNANIIPQIDVTVHGVTTTYADTGQILNTGGIDEETCHNGTNMSTQWTPIGSSPCPHAVLTVTPSAQSQEVGTTATLSATFTNSCGTPLAGANVDFTSLTGPNAGTIHMDTTDRSGNASFSYTSASSGTDTLQAAVTNLAGTITSPDGSVTWTNTASAPAAAASRGGGGGGSGGGGGGGCSLQPWSTGSPAAYLAALGNLALPVALLLLLRLWSWRRQR